MENVGTVFWSIGAMPIGLMLAFGPAMLVWYLGGGREYLAERSRRLNEPSRSPSAKRNP